MAREAAAVGGSLHLTHAGHHVPPAPLPPITAPHGGPGALTVALLALAGAAVALGLAAVAATPSAGQGEQHELQRRQRIAAGP